MSSTTTSGAPTNFARNDEDVYICPNGKKFRLKGSIWPGRQWDYQADAADCRVCTLRPQCCTKSKAGRRVLRSIYQPYYARRGCAPGFEFYCEAQVAGGNGLPEEKVLMPRG